MGQQGADMGTSATLAGGIFTQTAISAVLPFMVPVFAVYDVASAIHTAKLTQRCNTEWNEITKEWNEKFSVDQRENHVISLLEFNPTTTPMIT